MKSSGPWNVCSRLYNAKFAQKNRKPLFWEFKADLENLDIVSPYIAVSYKIALSFVKSVNGTS